MIMSFIIDVGSFVLCNQQSNQVLSLEIITMKYQPSAIPIFSSLRKIKNQKPFGIKCQNICPHSCLYNYFPTLCFISVITLEISASTQIAFLL